MDHGVYEQINTVSILDRIIIGSKIDLSIGLYVTKNVIIYIPINEIWGVYILSILYYYCRLYIVPNTIVELLVLTCTLYIVLNIIVVPL